MSKYMCEKLLAAADSGELDFRDSLMVRNAADAIAKLMRERDGLLEAMQASRANEARREAMAKDEALEDDATVLSLVLDARPGVKVPEVIKYLRSRAEEYRKQAEENHDGA
jgi:hypothetical protein